MLKLLTAGSALLFVLALIFATGAIGRWLSPRLSGYLAGRRLAARPPKSGGDIVIRPLDPRRRLHLAEINGCQVAILTGGPNDVMIALGPQARESLP